MQRKQENHRPDMSRLPIHELEAQLLAGVAQHPSLILAAPPGSGKTTQVPQMLLRSAAMTGRILVLQPRRLAARMVAARVAQEMNMPLGEIVGFQTRHERALSARTRILFMTEGLFLRKILAEPRLPEVSAVLLDEFHERSLSMDLALGLVLRLQRDHRPDLKLLVMSATLDVEQLRAYLDSPAIESQGRMHDVAVSYLPARSMLPVWDLAAEAVRQKLEQTQSGDVLVFMPGAYEIRKTLEACKRRLSASTGEVALLPLHSSLSPQEQDQAVTGGSRGSMNPGRRVIVSTNVAETSITIEGIEHVIDSGLAKVHRYDARRGLNVLQTQPISRASASQRAGRAGRTAPGTCLRLWTEADHRSRPAQDLPEVRRLDLCECVLQLLSMGITDIRAFHWLEPPEEHALQRAESQLQVLSAMTSDHQLTDMGRRMSRFPLHPRLSRMLIEAGARGCVARACLWAALLSEEPLLTGEPAAELKAEVAGQKPQCDLSVWEHAFELAAAERFHSSRCASLGVKPAVARQVEQTRRQLERLCVDADMKLQDTGTLTDLARCLLAAFPDEIALMTDAHRRACTLPGRKRVMLDRQSIVSEPGLLLALEVREVGAGEMLKTVISLACQVTEADLREVLPDRLQVRSQAMWNETLQAAEQVEQKCVGELVYDQTARPNVDPSLAAELLVQKISKGELKLERWDAKVEQWIARVRCVASWFPQRPLIRYSEEDLTLILHELVEGATRWGQVREKDCLPVVMGVMSYEDQQWVQQMAPEAVKLPAGYRMKLEYQEGQPPRGRARIQDFYDLQETPRVGGGRVKVLLEILGPNHRPVQITDDLPSFWTTHYPVLRKALAPRYPRHQWR